jgi:hypothetical protein
VTSRQYIDGEPEYTPTKSEWEDLQMRFDITPDGLQILTDEERADLEASRLELNLESVKAAISTLIERHPVEFEVLVREERVARNIHTETPQTEMGEYVEFLGISS